MPRLDPDKVAKRSETAWKRKMDWRDLRQSAYELALPMRNQYHSSGDGKPGGQRPGRRKMNNVFDSTLMVSTMRFANRLQGDLTPPFQKWAMLVPGAFIQESQKQEVSKKLAPINDAMFAAIHVSNFDTAVNEFYLDLAVGTAFMMVRKGSLDQPVMYEAIPQSYIALEEGPFGTITGAYRVWELERRLIKPTWKDFEVTMPEGSDKLAEDKPEEKLRLTEALYFDFDEDIWYYDVLLHGKAASRNASKKPDCIVQHTYVESPLVAARWIKVPGEVEGRGPVLFALPDAKTLNKVKELVLMNASIAVSGIWIGRDDGVLNPNTVRIRPGAVIPVAYTGGALGASLAPLETGADFNVADLVSADLIDSIQQIMMVKDLPPEEGPVRSATEIAARLRMLQEDIGSPFGRLMSEMIRPLIQKTLNVLVEQKIIPLAEGQRLKINGGTVDVQIQSPLALAQNLSEVQTAVNWIEMVKALGPEAFYLGVDVENVPDWLATKLGVDPVLPRSKEDREQAQKMIGAMLASQQGGAAPANDAGGVAPAVAA